MSTCPMTAACTFFDDQMADMPGMAKLIRTQFCQGDYNQCARYLVSTALGMGAVPVNLFPGHLDKAKLLVKESGD